MPKIKYPNFLSENSESDNGNDNNSTQQSVTKNL